MAKMANSKNQLSISADVAFIRKNLSQDMKPFPLGPNAKANPTAQNIMQEITVGKKIKSRDHCGKENQMITLRSVVCLFKTKQGLISQYPWGGRYLILTVIRCESGL